MARNRTITWLVPIYGTGYNRRGGVNEGDVMEVDNGEITTEQAELKVALKEAYWTEDGPPEHRVPDPAKVNPLLKRIAERSAAAARAAEGLL